MFAPTDVCGVIKGCEINNNAKCQGGWAVEGASPYNSEITASPEHGRTLFAPTDVCGVIKGCEINNNAKCQRGVGCRGRQPLHLIAMVCYAAKSLRSLRIYICSGRGWAVQILCSDITFIIVHTFFCFFSLNLHLVGLRRMRLCLKLRKGLCPLTLQAL